jgi:23S rRNA pseudouridine1911/1915/1917 synthase
MSNKNSVESLSIFIATNSQRLDAFISANANISREGAKQLILAEGVNVNKKTVLKPSLLLLEGDEVFLTKAIPLKQTSLSASSSETLNIIFEDEYIMVINKAAGVSTHPCGIEGKNTVANAIVGLVEEEGEGSVRNGIVHRLDKDTTGLLIIAKTLEASERIISMMASHEIERRYVALCYGFPRLPSFQIKTHMERDKNNRLKMKIVRTPTASSKEAITNVLLKEKLLNGSFSLLELKLETGRTHQIRLHLAYSSLCVVGDRTYGVKPPSFFNNFPLKLKETLENTRRQMLHAYKLDFTHPFTGKRVSFEAPIPDDFQNLLSVIKSS